MPDAAPNRALAALLALAAPLGLGHAYAGRTRRGVAWLVGCLVVFAVATAGAPAIASLLGGRTALVVFAIAMTLRWAGPSVDLLLMPRARFGKTDLTGIVVLLVVGVVAAVATSLGARILLLEAFKSPSGSMMPTLLVGDHLFVDKLAYRLREPRRGEVMVFAFPEHPEQDFIKRVIAVPGDQLEVKNGHPWLNGWEVPHCKVGEYAYTDVDSPIAHHGGELDVEFLGDQAYLTLYDTLSGVFPEQQGPYHAKAGEYWVMGDNRNNSHDSRMWYGGQGGGVPRALVRGHALYLWLSTREDGGVDFHRSGQSVEGPTLPAGSEALQGALDACMKMRPPLSATTPPRGS